MRNQEHQSRGRARLASPRPRTPSIVPPLKPMKTGDADPKERLFLEASEKGDKATLQSCLRGENQVNVNCTDLLGRSAIEIAVDNENMEIVEILLQQPNIRIGNALLYAIREGVYRLVEILINHSSITSDMLGDGWAKALDPSEAASSEYSSDISPVMLAAHLNQFEILQLLLSREANIHRPHGLACGCAVCAEKRQNDSLHHSLRRIHTFRALASPAWISLTSADPILTAFKLSWELQKLSIRENEFKDVYVQLSAQCKTFACDLLSQCRSTEEVIAVMNKDNSDADYLINDVMNSKLSLARLKLAVKYEQKQFVSHPHCQQLLTTIWYEGIPGVQERGSRFNALIYIVLIVAWPVLALGYIFFPKSRFGQIVRAPFMKFLYYSTSFGLFLFLLTMATFEEYRSQRRVPGRREPPRADDRGPSPTIVETLIVVWVIGMVWSEVKQLWEEGFKKYILQWWNWLDFIMMSLYLCTFCLRGTAYFIVRSGNGPSTISRDFWNWDEPVLIAEGLFAVANVFSFSRIIYLFQTNPSLGPLQISLGCMLIDIGKFLLIFFLILSSFSIGLAQLYWYYDPAKTECRGPNSTNCMKNPDAFVSIASSYRTLSWSLFSITKTEDTDVINDHLFTEMIGQGIFVAYHVTSIIVLLNMLIAMMSHSFQIINDHADMEWKFHRTKLWMSFFDEGSSLPSPFNLIITPKSFYYFFRRLICALLWCRGRYNWHTQSGSKRATIRRPGYHGKQRKFSTEPSSAVDKDMPLTYQDIMQRLVARYIHQTKKEMKMDGVNEDDLLEIKQDISSLRYELRDDRKKEIVRSASQIDTVKFDIMRTLTHTGSSPVGISCAQPIPRVKVFPSGSDISEGLEPETNSPTDSDLDYCTPPSGPPIAILKRHSPHPGRAASAWRPVQPVQPSPLYPSGAANPRNSTDPVQEEGVQAQAAYRCGECERHALSIRKELVELMKGELEAHFSRLSAQLSGGTPTSGPHSVSAEPQSEASTGNQGDSSTEPPSTAETPLLRNGRLYDTHLYTQC